MEEPKYGNEFVKCLFTDEEKKDIAAEMAQNIVSLQQAEDDLKAIKSKYKSQIDGIQAGINLAATKLTSGFEMKMAKCEIVPDYEKKTLAFVRVDTGELVKTADMTADDLQLEFGV